jgi:hypothetical protein
MYLQPFFVPAPPVFWKHLQGIWSNLLCNCEEQEKKEKRERKRASLFEIPNARIISALSNLKY